MYQNEIPNKHNESYNALLSRIPLYELKYTIKELKEISLDLLKKEKLTKEQENIAKELIQKQEIDYNLRIYKRIISFVKYDINKSEIMLNNSIRINKDKRVILNLLKKDLTEKERVKIFTELTGKSRRTYFRIKSAIVP